MVDEDIASVLTRWTLARALRQMDQGEQSLEVYQAIAPDLRENPEFLEDYALFLREMGYVDQARQNLQKYIALVPDDSQASQLLNELDD